MDHVIDRHLADKPIVLIDHGSADQIVFLEHQADLFLVEHDRDERLIALHHVCQRYIARRTQHPRQGAGSDRMMLFVDHEHFEELVGQVAPVAQVIDQVAHRQMFGHGHELAAHQAAGGFLGIGQGGLDRDPVLQLDLGQNGALVGLVQILDQLDGVVGFELVDDLRHGLGRQRFHHVLADIIVQLGYHLRRHQIGYGGG